MIKRYQMTFKAGVYIATGGMLETPVNLLCAETLRDWVNLPKRRHTIWLCISTAPKSTKYAYRFINKGPVHFITNDTDPDLSICMLAPLASTSDSFWRLIMPETGWAWIEYEA